MQKTYFNVASAGSFLFRTEPDDDKDRIAATQAQLLAHFTKAKGFHVTRYDVKEQRSFTELTNRSGV